MNIKKFFASASNERRKKQKLEPAVLDVLPAQKGEARATLPEVLFNFGMNVFQNDEAVLDAVVANTEYINLTFAGEPLRMRRVIGEPPDFGEGYDGSGNPNSDNRKFDGYGLASLCALKHDENGMLVVLDIGANEGAVSIAAFKKCPRSIRIIAVEPVPSTYFLLCWNMWLNGVDMWHSPERFLAQPSVPGALLLNNGVSQTDGEVLGLCYTPPQTMNARICDCALQGPATQEGKEEARENEEEDEEKGDAALVEVRMRKRKEDEEEGEDEKEDEKGDEEEEEEEGEQQGFTQCANVVSSSFGALVNLFTKSELAFLKVDCEGCEKHVLPALMLFSQQYPGWKVGRLAGELHAVSNQIEDLACNFEGGKGWSHVCEFDLLWERTPLLDLKTLLLKSRKRKKNLWKQKKTMIRKSSLKS